MLTGLSNGDLSLQPKDNEKILLLSGALQTRGFGKAKALYSEHLSRSMPE